VILLLLVFKARISLIPLSVGLFVFALIFAPYVYYDATHGWANFRTFAEVSRGPGTFDLKSAQIIGVFVVEVLNWTVSLANGLKAWPLVRFLMGKVLPASLMALIIGLALWQGIPDRDLLQLRGPQRHKRRSWSPGEVLPPGH